MCGTSSPILLETSEVSLPHQDHLARYASHLGLPAVMLQLHGTNHTNLARFEFIELPFICISCGPFPYFVTSMNDLVLFSQFLLRLVSNHIAKGANFQVWVQVNLTQILFHMYERNEVKVILPGAFGCPKSSQV